MAGKLSEYAAMGGAGGTLFANTTMLLIPSSPGDLSKSRMAAFVLLKRSVPLTVLGLRMTCPFSEAVLATEQRRLKAAKDRRFNFIHEVVKISFCSSQTGISRRTRSSPSTRHALNSDKKARVIFFLVLFVFVERICLQIAHIWAMHWPP